MPESRIQRYRQLRNNGPAGTNPEERRRYKKIFWIVLWSAVVIVVLSLIISAATAPTMGSVTARPPAAAESALPQPIPTIQSDSPAPTQAVAQSNEQPADGSYSSADLAYCKTSGKLVKVAASGSFRAAICSEGSQMVYYGLSKKTGGTIKLSAVQNGDEFVATNMGTTYRLGKAGFEITDDAGNHVSEPMTYWLSPGDAELENPGDLGISRGISYPLCDGAGVVILGTAYEPKSYAADVEALLAANPGSEYLRTDLSCDNFRGPSVENSGGQYIYAVYRVVGRDQSDVCAAIKGAETYGDWLENNVDPADRISCS